MVPIELEKLTKQLKNNEIDKKDKAMLWSLFIKNPERMGEKEMSENEDIKRAKEENQKQFIINLYKMKMNIEDIAKVAELGKEEVEKIIKENK